MTEYVVAYMHGADDFPAVTAELVILTAGGPAAAGREADRRLAGVAAANWTRFCAPDEDTFKGELDFVITELSTWLRDARERGEELM